MTDQDNDDEIRESIPCVTVDSNGGVFCLPVGYDGYLRWRGTILDQRYGGEAGAWKHAIEREKARRARVKDERNKVIADLLRAMRMWGAEEDGIPDFAADVYDRAASLIGEPLIPEDDLP